MREKTRPADPAGADAFPTLFGGKRPGTSFPAFSRHPKARKPAEEGHPEPDEGDKGAITAEETGASEDADHIRSEKPAETEAVPPPKSDDGEPPFDLYQFYPGSRPADGRQDDGKFLNRQTAAGRLVSPEPKGLPHNRGIGEGTRGSGQMASPKRIIKGSVAE